MQSFSKSETDIDLSIIVLSYNTARLTILTVESIYASLKNVKYSFEIVVFDNASSDNSPEVLGALVNKYQNLQLILNKKNLGFSKGNNTASRLARGKYILFLNSDIIVENDSISKLFYYIKDNSNSVHFVGGKLFNKDGSAQPSIGPFYSLPVIFGALFLKGDYWGLTRQSPNKPCKVDWVSGACLLTSKKLFNDIGGFDDNIFMYMDEIDLLYRAKKHKFNTFFYPYSTFIHLGSASSDGKTYPIIQVYKGLMYFYRKHHTSIATFMLILMLKLKAYIAIFIGRVRKNQYLYQTYAKTLEVIRTD